MGIKITEKQKEQFKYYREKWNKIGVSTEKCDRKEAEKWLDELYKSIGMKPVKINNIIPICPITSPISELNK